MGGNRRSEGIRAWLRRNVLALIGLFLAVIGVATAVWIAYGQNQLAGDIAEDQDQLARDLEAASEGQVAANEIQENVRFVRQVVIDNAEKPFSKLNLHGASLNGLDLACEDLKTDPPTGCANLSDANLTGADLNSADLTGANLDGANLTEAFLTDAYLSGTLLKNAVLTDAYLNRAYLYGADLRGANLTRANVANADLTLTDLTNANLTDADLSNTKLTRAYLYGADLTGADLIQTVLDRVCYDGTTKWPDGFEPPPPPKCD
jgi:uncharacterized protein YjbI with pentapeptide repeats